MRPCTVRVHPLPFFGTTLVPADRITASLQDWNRFDRHSGIKVGRRVYQEEKSRWSFSLPRWINRLVLLLLQMMSKLVLLIYSQDIFLRNLLYVGMPSLPKFERTFHTGTFLTHRSSATMRCTRGFVFSLKDMASTSLEPRRREPALARELSPRFTVKNRSSGGRLGYF